MIIVVVIIVLVVFSGPIYMYIRARQAVTVDVRALTIDEIIEIGTKTSESALRRIRGRADVFSIPDVPGGVAWHARNGHVYATYLAVPFPDGTGYRVAASVRVQALVKMFSVRDAERASKAHPHGVAEYVGGQVGSWLGQKIWLWSNARKVLFRRWQTFAALKRADARKLAAMSAPSGPHAPEFSAGPGA
jgi:hypothetical protein